MYLESYELEKTIVLTCLPVHDFTDLNVSYTAMVYTNRAKAILSTQTNFFEKLTRVFQFD